MGERGNGRRLVMSASARASCKNFIIFNFAAINRILPKLSQFVCHRNLVKPAFIHYDIGGLAAGFSKI